MKPGIQLATCLLGLATLAGATDPTAPTFFARRDYTGLNAGWVQVADTNGDGVPDLIAALSNYIQVLFGNGDGTFGPAGANTGTNGGGDSFVAADVNGDGIVDIVQPGDNSQNQSGMGVCLGNGDGTFQKGTFYPVADNGPGFLGSVVIGDFNGDGILDVAGAGGSGIWLWTGKGGGLFNAGVLAVPLSTGGGSIAATDFSGNGKLDIVATMAQSFAVLLGNGNGTFQAPKVFSLPSFPSGLALGALTKGGHPSIAVSTGSDAYLYFGNGAGGFAGPRVVSLPSSSRGVAIGDLNNDGIPDLVSPGGYIAFGTGAGEFKPALAYPVENLEGDFRNVVLADLRGNGMTDIVTDDVFGVSVLLNLGIGKFEDGIWTRVTGGSGCGAAADYNGDGRPDLAVNTPSGITILLGTGTASKPFTTGATIATETPGCPVTGDLNGDGIPDLLIPVNGNPNAILAYLGNGDGTFTLAGTTPTPDAGGSVVLADFNNDGKLDFATSGNLLALGNGDGTFQTPAAIVASPPKGGFSGIAAGDINNDGWPDLVLTNDNISPYYDAYVLLNNQKGGFNQVPATFGEFTEQPVLADLNGNGFLDLVLAAPTSSRALVYLGNGTGQFTTGPELGGVFGAFNSFNVAADVNGDGIPDILILGSNSVVVYLGLGGAAYGTPFDIGLGPSPGQVLVEDLHGQRPSAGIPDIVAPDTSGGVMVLTNETKK